MKHVNFVVFVGLLMFVAGCQKKQDVSGSKKIDTKIQKQRVARRGATKLETKKSAAQKKTVVDKGSHE